MPACESSDVFFSGFLFTLPSPGIVIGSPATLTDQVIWIATFSANDTSVSFAWCALRAFVNNQAITNGRSSGDMLCGVELRGAC